MPVLHYGDYIHRNAAETLSQTSTGMFLPANRNAKQNRRTMPLYYFGKAR